MVGCSSSELELHLRSSIRSLHQACHELDGILAVGHIASADVASNACRGPRSGESQDSRQWSTIEDHMVPGGASDMPNERIGDTVLTARPRFSA